MLSPKVTREIGNKIVETSFWRQIFQRRQRREKKDKNRSRNKCEKDVRGSTKASLTFTRFTWTVYFPSFCFLMGLAGHVLRNRVSLT